GGEGVGGRGGGGGGTCVDGGGGGGAALSVRWRCGGGSLPPPPPLQQVGHASRGPAAVRQLLPPEHRDRGLALLLRHEFGLEVGELELQREFVIVEGLILTQVFLDARDAPK